MDAGSEAELVSVRKAFDASIEESLEDSDLTADQKRRVRLDIDMAHYDSRFGGIDSLQAIEAECRKLDLAQIGYVFLSTIGEANHGSWDGLERSDLLAWDLVCKDLIFCLKAEDPIAYKSGLSFGGMEHWDEQGIRHTK